jgi:hypothetical protein
VASDIPSKNIIFLRHAGLDPASSSATRRKDTGFRVKPGMTKVEFPIGGSNSLEIRNYSNFRI